MPIKIEAHPTATGIFTLTNPNSASARGITLPDADTTLVGIDVSQTLTNKTIQSSTMQGGVITYGTALATTSGTVVDFTGIPSWAKRITLIFSGVSSSGTSNYLIQTGTSGGFTTTGYSSGVQSGVSAVASTTGFVITHATTATTAWNGTLVLTNLGNSWFCSSALNIVANGAVAVSAGAVAQAGLNAIRVTTTAGTDTFDAGTIGIIYEG